MSESLTDSPHCPPAPHCLKWATNMGQFIMSLSNVLAFLFIDLLLCPLDWDLVIDALTSLTHQPTIGLLSSHPVFTRMLHSLIIKLFALTGISRLSGYFCRFWQIHPLIVWHNDSKQRHDKCPFRLFFVISDIVPSFCCSSADPGVNTGNHSFVHRKVRITARTPTHHGSRYKLPHVCIAPL